MATDASRMTPDRSRLWRSVVVVGLCLILWMVPPVGPLKPQAMHLIAIFAATILGLILQPLPMGAIVIGALALTTITGTLPVKDAMSGFSEALVWLIVSAFMFSRGFIKTGLGRRIAFLLVRAFGKSMLGLGYALTISDTIIAPATPSNTARAGGILFPIVRSLAVSLGSEPGSARERVGAFLMFNEFQTTLMTSAIFLTGTAGNAMVVKLAKDAFKYEITWMGWLWASLVPGLVALLVVPYVIFLLTKPEVKRSPDAAAMATRELEKMGPMARSEKNMFAVFLLTLTLWATGQWTGFDATAVALVGVAVLLATRVLTWDDVLTERGGWDALIWFGGFVSLAGGLSSLKIITYLADVLKSAVGGVHSWVLGFLLVVLAFKYSHYLLSSVTAHALAFFVPMGLVAVEVGAPLPLVMYCLGFMNCLCCAMTHYSTGPSPIYYNAGYISLGAWWRNGFIISLVNLVIWLGVGGVWWKVIGLW